VSHPSLGLPPLDRTASLPPAAARVEAARGPVARRHADALVSAGKLRGGSGHPPAD